MNQNTRWNSEIYVLSCQVQQRTKEQMIPGDIWTQYLHNMKHAQSFVQTKDELEFILHVSLNIQPTPGLEKKFLSALPREKRVYKMA